MQSVKFIATVQEKRGIGRTATARHGSECNEDQDAAQTRWSDARGRTRACSAQPPCAHDVLTHEQTIQVRATPAQAFAPIRADAKYRAAVGLDRPAATGYERVMGFGGQWEQTGTSCDTPEIRLVLKRDRSVKLNVKSSCNGQVYDIPFRGT